MGLEWWCNRLKNRKDTVPRMRYRMFYSGERENEKRYILGGFRQMCKGLGGGTCTWDNDRIARKVTACC